MIERADLDTKYLNTCFDRQVRIDLWNQDKLAQQTILILGVGGLGSAVLMNVLRLGVKRVIIIDYDVVDIHNLNRQIMYGLADVGKSKVEAALKNCQHHNVGGTEVVGENLDAVKQWGKVVEYVRQSNVVYNCIDYGDKYDVAVASLCMSLKVPLIMGGTFATSFTIDYINPEGNPCFLCFNDEYRFSAAQKEIVLSLTPDKIQSIASLAHLPKNNNPVGRSSMMVCLMCAELMVSHMVNYFFLSEEPVYRSARLIGYHNTFEIVKFDMEVVKTCPFCGDPNYVEPVKEEAKVSAEQINDQQKGSAQAQPNEAVVAEEQGQKPQQPEQPNKQNDEATVTPQPSNFEDKVQ